MDFETVEQYLKQVSVIFLHLWFPIIWWPFIAVTAVFPSLFVLALYISACIVPICRLSERLLPKFLSIFKGADFTHVTLTGIALFWSWHGRIYHGVETIGWENIPSEGPALIVYYHGQIPIDYYYLVANYYLLKKRLMRTIAAEYMFKTPGLRDFLHAIHGTPGTVEEIAEVMKSGEIVAVSPGGMRESFFSDSKYELIWNKRTGFAKAACLAKVPIIPVFTRNIRESYRSWPLLGSLSRSIYERTKFPLALIYGGFPVKLKTFIGEPIPYDANLSPEEVAEKTAQALRELIQKNQTLPGSIVGALMERFG